MEPYVDDAIVLTSEGFVEDKTGWSLRRSGAFELFAFGKMRVRSAASAIDPRFLIIDKKEMAVTKNDHAFGVHPITVTVNESTVCQGSVAAMPLMQAGEIFCERSARLEIVLALIKAGCNPSVATLREAGRLYTFVSGGNSEAGEQ